MTSIGTSENPDTSKREFKSCDNVVEYTAIQANNLCKYILPKIIILIPGTKMRKFYLINLFISNTSVS